MRGVKWQWCLVCAVLLGTFCAMPTAAHETDNFSIPREKKFADLGPLFTRIFYRNIERATRNTNQRIREAVESGASEDKLAKLRLPCDDRRSGAPIIPADAHAHR